MHYRLSSRCDDWLRMLWLDTPRHGKTVGVDAADSLGESLTAMAIYRADATGDWQRVFIPAAGFPAASDEQENVEALAARL